MAPWSLPVLADRQAACARRPPDNPCPPSTRQPVLAGWSAARPDGGGLRRVPGFVEAVVAHDQLLDLLQLACVKCWRRFVE